MENERKEYLELLNILTVTALAKLAVNLLGHCPGLGYPLGLLHLSILQFLALLSKFSFVFYIDISLADFSCLHLPLGISDVPMN